MLATWDKGWSISERVGWLYSLGLNALGTMGTRAELFRPVAELFRSEAKSERAKLDMDPGAPGRTMLDMRKGAPFIVQTRLLWTAYRRWNTGPLRDAYNNSPRTLTHLKDAPKDARNPPVIQIIGTTDNFVSPQDQINDDVEGADGQSK